MKEYLKVKKSLPVSRVNINVFELRFVHACVCVCVRKRVGVINQDKVQDEWVTCIGSGCGLSSHASFKLPLLCHLFQMLLFCVSFLFFRWFPERPSCYENCDSGLQGAINGLGVGG